MAKVENLLDTTAFILGPDVPAFESEVAKYLNVPAAIGVSNGTDAIWLSLKALGVGPGDKVLTTPFTFFATISAIMNTGATPVFADIDPKTFNIDPKKVEAALADHKVKAMIVVHLYGQAADMDELNEIAKRHGVGIVEDAAQAIGARYREKNVGALGDFASFSFFPSKNLGGIGDGGLVTTKDSAGAERIKMLRTHGSKKKYYHEVIGGNFRLDTLQAAVLRVFLPHLDSWLGKRQAAADYYDAKLAEYADVFETPFRASDRNHTFHQYTLRVKTGSRDDLAAFLNEKKIGNAVYYPVPCHLQKALQGLGYERGQFPLSEAAAEEAISLPIFPEITREQQDEVVGALVAFARRSDQPRGVSHAKTTGSSAELRP